MYLFIVLELLNVMRLDVILWLILVHVLSHVHHKIHRVMLHIKQVTHTLITDMKQTHETANSYTAHMKQQRTMAANRQNAVMPHTESAVRKVIM